MREIFGNFDFIRLAFMRMCLAFLTCLFFLLIICGLCSCSSESNAPKNSQNENFANFSREVTDIYGRNVYIPDVVECISSVGSATRLCVYAGVADKLISITEIDKKNVLRPYTLAYCEKFCDLPVTNNGNHLNSTDVDVEKLMDLSPDVIFSTRSSDECQSLQEKSKIPVIGVFSQDEMYGGQLEQSLRIIGDVCSSQSTVEDLISFLNSSSSELSQYKLENIRAYRGAINYKGSKGLCGTISSYCVWNSINLNNVANISDLDGAYDTTYEQIVDWNPELIIIDYQNKDKVLDEYNSHYSSLNNIEAFKKNNIYSVAPFNNNGTNVEYALCEAYYAAYISSEYLGQNNLFENEEQASVAADQKAEEIMTKLLHKNVWKELKDGGVKFGKVEIENK